MELSDIDVSPTNSNKVTVTGYIRTGIIYKGLVIQSNDGFASSPDPTFVTNTSNLLHFDNLSYFLNGDFRILGNDGVYDQNRAKIYSITSNNIYIPHMGFKFSNNNFGVAALNNGQLIETTNGGYNWSTSLTLSPSSSYSRSSISSFGEIVFYGDAVTNILHTRRLSTNLLSYFDNQSSSGSLSFDGTSYNTPTQVFLRGGISTLSTQVLNSGQSNERILYKWFDNYMYNDHKIYFDTPGNTFSNYYKTKQLSTVSSAISNTSQAKSVRDTTIDNVTTTHTVHESMDGINFASGVYFYRIQSNDFIQTKQMVLIK